MSIGDTSGDTSSCRTIPSRSTCRIGADCRFRFCEDNAPSHSIRLRSDICVDYGEGSRPRARLRGRAFQYIEASSRPSNGARFSSPSFRTTHRVWTSARIARIRRAPDCLVLASTRTDLTRIRRHTPSTARFNHDTHHSNNTTLRERVSTTFHSYC